MIEYNSSYFSKGGKCIMEKNNLVADVIDAVINRSDAEFEKAIKEGHYSDAEQLLRQSWVKVTQVATDLWWHHVI